MMESAKKEYWYWTLITVTFLFYLWLAFQIPYTHDDWDWGIQIGITHLLTADINSRYIGNLTEVMLTRSPLLKACVMGAVFMLIPVVSVRLVCACLNPEERGKRGELIRICLFSFANIMLLSMPTDVWRQTNGWVAGFSNFVVSGLLLLVFFLQIFRIHISADPRGNSAATCVGVFFFGVMIQLFLENLSVYFLLVSALFNIILIIRKKQSKAALFLLAGTVFGFLIMFSSGIYSSLWSTGYAVGTYRKLMYDRSRPLWMFLRDAGRRYVRFFVPQMIGQHSLLAASVSLLLFLRGLRLLRGKKSSAAAVLTSVLTLVFAGYYLCCRICGSPFEDGKTAALIDCVFCCVVMAAVFLLFRQDRKKLCCLYITWLSAFAVMAPMVVINSVGPRSFYTVYLCLILFSQLLLADLLTQVSGKLQKTAAAAALCLFLLLGVSMARVYGPIGAVAREREAIIQRGIAEQSTEITLPPYPNSRYLWFPNPVEDREKYFRAFYHIPEGISIQFNKWEN